MPEVEIIKEKDKKIFIVDVGDLSKEDAIKYIEEIKQKENK